MAAYEASDFLWANTKNVTPTASKVMLTFRHQMSSARIRFSQGTGWDDAAEYAAVAKEVLVTSTVRKSTINLATGVVTPEGEALLTGIVPMKDYDEFRAIVVPQTVPAGQTLLTLTIDGRPRHYVRDVDTEYVPGKITTYDLSVSKKPNTGEYEVELIGVNITAWEADNVSHGDDAREYVVVYNAIPGDLEKTITERLEMDPTKIKNLKLTGSITAADYTFMRDKMTSLQRVNLKEVESVVNDVYQIPAEAFYGKTTLIKCVMPDRLERIEDLAFVGTSLTGALQLPEGLKYVAGFGGTKITSVHLPSTLEIIGGGRHSGNAFSDCKSLMCEISFPSSLRIIEGGAFSNSSIQGNLSLPRNLESIGSGAFGSCSGLSGSLVIPDKIEVVPSGAFYGCGFTGTLTLPKGLVKIGTNAFSETDFKGELNLPSSVATIESYAFSNTLFNGTLVLPSELISLGSGVFSGCWRLSGVVEIPENIVAVPSQLFYGCTGLEGIKIHKMLRLLSLRHLKIVLVYTLSSARQRILRQSTPTHLMALQKITLLLRFQRLRLQGIVQPTIGTSSSALLLIENSLSVEVSSVLSTPSTQRPSLFVHR